MTFKEAMRIMPACLVGALDRPATIADLRFAALHEIECFEADEDGHLEETEIELVEHFLDAIKVAHK